ncbi:sensor histidine kinase [Nesterenkonia ebinurensis]|uniref:sensor histidine kinase n=1 Tax=Nesterenkonia ebinurensis TaxID=2608252 RepID=UPI00123CE048|nr:histidine kinase [Nesterenkonia ebinurensis]
MEHRGRPSRDSRAWLIATGVLVVLLLALLALGQDSPYLIVALSLIVAAAVLITTWAFVRSRAQRRIYEDQLTAWASERAVQTERLRIARDLHDLASHGLGLMTVRAATATLTGEEDDAERRRALTDIERLGRETTTELRRMLALLRSNDETPAPLQPVDSLAELPRIIDHARRAGLTITVHQDDLGDLAPGVQLTLCAIIREALANTLQHAGPTTVDLTIQRTGEAVSVDVRDAGPVPDWRPHPGTGNGLRGLHERLTIHHGTLTTGQVDDGFRLLAQLPEKST